MHRDVQPVLGYPSWRSGEAGQVETAVSSMMATPSSRSSPCTRSAKRDNPGGCGHLVGGSITSCLSHRVSQEHTESATFPSAPRLPWLGIEGRDAERPNGRSWLVPGREGQGSPRAPHGGTPARAPSPPPAGEALVGPGMVSSTSCLNSKASV